jgi:hypothetical protein
LTLPSLEFRLQAVRGIHHPLPRKRGTPNETPAYFGGSARMLPNRTGRAFKICRPSSEQATSRHELARHFDFGCQPQSRPDDRTSLSRKASRQEGDMTISRTDPFSFEGPNDTSPGYQNCGQTCVPDGFNATDD